MHMSITGVAYPTERVSRGCVLSSCLRDPTLTYSPDTVLRLPATSPSQYQYLAMEHILPRCPTLVTMRPNRVQRCITSPHRHNALKQAQQPHFGHIARQSIQGNVSLHGDPPTLLSDILLLQAGRGRRAGARRTRYMPFLSLSIALNSTI